MRTRLVAALPLAGVLALALALRLYRFPDVPLGLQYDEAFNGFDALDVLAGHRPIFFPGNNGREPLQIYLTALAMAFFGPSHLAIRLPSVVAGVATVAVVYCLAREWFTWLGWGQRTTRPALYAALFLALLQWHLHFSRMGYRAILVPLFGALAFLFVLRALRSGRTRDFVAAGLVIGLGQYTYVSARLLPAAAGLVVLLGLACQSRRPSAFGRKLMALAIAAGLTAAPLATHFWNHPDQLLQHSADVSVTQLGGLPMLLENVERTAGGFLFRGDGNWRHNLGGRPAFDPLSGVCFLLGLIACVLAAARGEKGKRERGEGESARRPAPREKPNGRPNDGGEETARPRVAALAALGWVGIFLVPTLLSEGAPHFLRGIGVLPALVLLPALGLDLGRRWLDRLADRGSLQSPTPSSAPAGGSGLFSPLRRVPGWVAFSPGEQGQGRSTTPGRLAVLVVAAVTGWATFQAYFNDWADRAETYYFLTTDYIEAANAIRRLGGGPSVYLDTYLAEHRTLAWHLRGQAFQSFDARRTWVVPRGEAAYVLPPAEPDFPAARLEELTRLVAGARQELSNSREGPMLVVLRKPAGLEARPALSTTEQPLAPATFGDQFRLFDYAVDGRADQVAAGRPMTVTLAWEVLRPGNLDDTFSLKLYDAEDHVWAQRDERPGGGTYPASAWVSGETVFDRLALGLPADLPPGRYRLELAMYSLASRRNLPVARAGGPPSDRVVLGPVVVPKPSPLASGSVRPPRRIDADLAPGLTLLGFGFEPAEVRSGQDVRLHLYWQAGAPMAPRLQALLKLSDRDGRLVAERQEVLGGSYPTERWRPGDVLHEVKRLAVAGRATGGPSSLTVRVVGGTGEPASIELPGPMLLGRERRWDLPTNVQAMATRLGDLAELAGYRLDLPEGGLRPGGRLGVLLVWRALAESTTNYVVFVQLLNAEGRLVAQRDRPPQDGGAPTVSWLSGEVIEDRHELALPADFLPGGYRLIAGLYDPRTMQRLPPATGGDHLVLGPVTVTSQAR